METLCLTQVTVNRKRKLEQLAQPEGQTIHDLMQKFRTKRRGLATNTACPPPSLKIPELSAPKQTDVLRFLSKHIFSLHFYLHYLQSIFHLFMTFIVRYPRNELTMGFD